MPPPLHAVDDPTRERLLDAAGAVFAEQGFQSTTIRDICNRAGANVAAVNYHFRDKLGLYFEVLHASVCAAEAQAGSPAQIPADPEQALAAFVTSLLNRLNRAGERGVWHLRLMVHEMASPSEAFPRIVDEIIGPRYSGLRAIVGEMLALPPDDPTVRLCAHSVIGQVVHYIHARPVIARVWPELEFSEEAVSRIASHITAFSLGGIHAIAERKSNG